LSIHRITPISPSSPSTPSLLFFLYTSLSSHPYTSPAFILFGGKSPIMATPAIGTLKKIQGGDIAKIASGQVIVDLRSVVKELVENALVS
jgi:singapore isolate B (sub-type 7) whole genome shotgun sequence assembly, scaffold_22